MRNREDSRKQADICMGDGGGRLVNSGALGHVPVPSGIFMAPSKKNKQALRSAFGLLAPHARPILPLLILATLLSALAAAATSAVIVLISPVFNLILFADLTEEQIKAGADAAGGWTGVGEAGVFDSFFVAVGESIRGGLGGTFLEDPRLGILAAVLFVLVVLTVTASLFQYLFNQLSNYVSLRMIVSLRLRITKHLMGLGLHYHGQRKLGDLLSRISSDMQMTLGAVKVVFCDLMQNGFLAVGYLIAAFSSEPMLTGVMLISMPLVAIPVSILSRKVRKRSTKSLTSLGASVQVLSQMFLGIRTVKAFRAEKDELNRYEQLNKDYLTVSMRMVKAQSQTQAWTTFSTQIGLGVLLLIVGLGGVRYGWFSGEDAIGSLSLFFLANAQAYTHIKRFIRAITSVEESVGASERLLELLNETPDIVEKSNASDMAEFHDKVAFRKVGFSYPAADAPAIHDLDLEIHHGETLAIVGASGSGKSTLMGLVCRFFDPTSGSIEVDGHDLRDLSLDSWMGSFSMVDQAPFLFHTSIAENLRYAKKDATDQQLFDACRAAQIHDFILGLPEGYETNVADAGARLSGGQRQRITIARALLKGSPILLLDEATSSLDTESERGVQEALDTLMAGRTVIVIAHRLSTIQNADRIAVLENGRLAELGTHAELQAKGGAYARALELQSVS